MVAKRCLSLVVALVVGIATAGAVPAQTCGDPDHDDAVTDTDGVLVLRAAALLSSSCTVAICDVDGDGQITDTDAVNVLRSAVDLPAARGCGSEVSRFLAGVSTSDGVQGNYHRGEAPVPAVDAPQTVTAAEGEAMVASDGEGALAVSYSTGGAAQIAAASDVALIICAQDASGVPAEGFIELPLGAPAGTVDLVARFGRLADRRQFKIGFATRVQNRVSRYRTKDLQAVACPQIFGCGVCDGGFRNGRFCNSALAPPCGRFCPRGGTCVPMPIDTCGPGDTSFSAREAR